MDGFEPPDPHPQKKLGGVNVNVYLSQSKIVIIVHQSLGKEDK